MGNMRKSFEHLRRQVEEVNDLRNTEGRELLYPAPEDFLLNANGLREKYGEQYDEYLADLKKVVAEKILRAASATEVHDAARELLGDDQYREFESQLESSNLPAQGKKELLNFKKVAMRLVLSLSTISVTVGGSGVMLERYSRQQHAERLDTGGGRINPILKAQSGDGLIFKGDNGVNQDFNGKTEHYSSVEHVIAYPGSIAAVNESKKAAVEKKYAAGLITAEEQRVQLWEIENTKQQGIIDSYEKRIMTVDQLVDQIKDYGKKGINTTLNFGDSSTSGWNSNVLTDNAITIARELYPKLRELDPSLPASFNDFVERRRGIPLGEDIEQEMSRAAEQLKKHPQFQRVWKENWDSVRGKIKSPFITYDTYSEKMAQIDPSHHYVNLGVPGYSSQHGKVFAKRMLDQLRVRGVLQYINSATIYFGNNDSVNNGNLEDKYFIGDDVSSKFHALGILRERFPEAFNATRVDADDYAFNLRELIETLRSRGIKDITVITPVVPYDWSPGQRAIGTPQEDIDRQYENKGKVSRLFAEAQESFTEYELLQASRTDVPPINYDAVRRKAEEAIKLDYMVPRVKKEYVRKAAEVAGEAKVNFINIEAILPIRDRSSGRASSPKDPGNITNDYCHPGERVNILLAAAQSEISGGDRKDIEQRATNQLVNLGVNEQVAKMEVSKVLSLCIVQAGDSVKKYKEISEKVRTRPTWDDRP